MQTHSDDEYNPEAEGMNGVRGEGGGGEGESENSAESGEMGSEIETPDENGDVGEVLEEEGGRKGGSSRLLLIGPRKTTVPKRYHGYQTFVKNALEGVRGEGRKKKRKRKRKREGVEEGKREGVKGGEREGVEEGRREGVREEREGEEEEWESERGNGVLFPHWMPNVSDWEAIPEG